MRIRKLYDTNSTKYRFELVIGWRSIPLTGYWFRWDR